MSMASGSCALTNFSRDATRNWILSINRSCPRESEMYFSVLLGMLPLWRWPASVDDCRIREGCGKPREWLKTVKV